MSWNEVTLQSVMTLDKLNQGVCIPIFNSPSVHMNRNSLDSVLLVLYRAGRAVFSYQWVSFYDHCAKHNQGASTLYDMEDGDNGD